jgi:hypothetical protein
MEILVECDADEVVLHNLGVPRKQLLHFGGKDKLINRLRKLPGAIGVVDEDPTSTQHPDLKTSYRQTNSAEGLCRLVRQGSGKQRLIIVCPMLESWLIRRARLSEIRPEDYGLPSDPNRLHHSPHYEQKESFHRFLSELTKQDKGMQLLRQWILEKKF